MLPLRTRDTSDFLPAAEVQDWVAESDLTIKVSIFLAALIVYDAGERSSASISSDF